MKNKNEISVNIFFAFLGLLFLIVGIIIGINYKNNLNKTKEISATITDIQSESSSHNETSYKVYVEYIVDGTKYNNVLGYFSSNMYIGKKIDIRYNLDDPNKIYAGEVTATILFIGGGLISFMAGIIPFVIQNSKNRKFLKLKKNGRKIFAEIECVEIDYSYSVNGQHPYIIKACYKDEINCEVYIFYSNRIWFDAEKIIEEFNISTIPVYIYNNDFNKYFVDHEEIEKYIKSS